MIDQAVELGPEEGLIQVQGNKYEGLVVWFNQMVESAGTSVLVGPRGDRARARADRAARSRSWAGSRPPTPPIPSITTSEEDPGRLAFQSGSSAFMINYPFVYPSAKEEAPDVFKVMKAAKYPAVDEGTPSAPPLGGINLGVSAFSQNQDLAFEAIECLIQPENQLETATAGGLPPVREDLYDSKEIDEIYPGLLGDHPRVDRRRRRAPLGVARLPGHLAGDPGCDPPDHRHRPRGPERNLRRAAATSSSRRSTGRGCCERRR